MKATIVGDLHAKPDTLEKCKEVLDLATSLGNEINILTGDVMHYKEIVRGRVLSFLINYFKNNKLNWTILVGNHDLFNLHDTEHSLEFLGLLPNVTVVDRPLTLKGISYVPYIHDVERFRNALSAMPKDNLLITHPDIKSFDYGNGRVSTSGIDLEDINIFDEIIAGHYHLRQERGNLTYIGTPYTGSFGETDQEKFIMEIDTKTYEKVWHKTNLPMHTTIDIDLNLESTEIANERIKELSEDSSLIGRVRVSGTDKKVAELVFPDNIKKEITILQDEYELSDKVDMVDQYCDWAREIEDYSDELVEISKGILLNV